MNYVTNASKIIGFDMDGVVVDNSYPKLLVLEKLGWRLNLTDTPSEIIQRILPSDVLIAMRKGLYDDLEISLKAEAMRGICDLMGNLLKNHVPYFLISKRREPKIAVELLRHLKIWPAYFNESNTFFVLTAEDKNAKARELEVTHYVDDETKVLGVLKDVPNKFLFDNFEVFPRHDSYVKVASHEELKKYFVE